MPGQGPVQDVCLRRSFADFNVEQSLCSQFLHFEHLKDVCLPVITFVQMGQYQAGPGLISTPARISNSLRNPAGMGFLIVGQIKNLGAERLASLSDLLKKVGL